MVAVGAAASQSLDTALTAESYAVGPVVVLIALLTLLSAVT